jgi:subtilisin-like proprotein convertase family protein
MGDFDGDGNDELIAAKATVKATEVRIYSLTGGGRIGALLEAFVPFVTAKSRGVSVATGDLNADGRDELIVGAGPGDVPHVKIFGDTDSDGLLGDNNTDTFLAFDTKFRGGVKVAAGNTNNVGGDEVVAASGSAGGTIAIFNDANANLVISDDAGGVALETFTPFGAKFRGGLNVAAGMIENAGNNGAEVIVGNATGKPKIVIHTDADNDGKVGADPIFDTLLPAGKGFASGARVAAGDTDDSGTFVEVPAAPAASAGAKVKIFDDTIDAGSLLSDNPPAEFDAFAKLGGGLNLAFGKVRNAAFAYAGSPQFIPESGQGSLNSSFFVPAGSGVIRDLDINLNIFHTFTGDLDVTLTHVASGTTITLFTDVGGTDEGFIIRLNDEVGTDIGTANNATDGAISGSFNPQGAALLSAFDGLNMAGEWRLTITDDNAAGADTGTLFTWGLSFTL